MPTSNPMGHHKRKKKLINSALQLKLVGVFLAISCIASLFQVVLLNRSLRALADDMPEGGGAFLTGMPGMLVTNMLLTLGFLVPLTFLVGLLVTHRIAGPAFQMTRYCRNIAGGAERPGPCRIRKDDELQDLCEALNGALARAWSEAPTPALAGQEPEEVPSLVTAADNELESPHAAPQQEV